MTGFKKIIAVSSESLIRGRQADASKRDSEA